MIIATSPWWQRPQDWLDWATVASIVFGATLSLAGSFMVNRVELTRKQRIRMHLDLLPPLYKDIRVQLMSLQTGGIANINVGGHIAVLQREACLAGRRDRKMVGRFSGIPTGHPELRDTSEPYEAVHDPETLKPWKESYEQLRDLTEQYMRFVERKVR